MSEFQSGLLEFQGLLSKLAADKGLANYDSGDKLETMLKNIVNATKNLLSATDVLVYRIPILGPILGPSKYSSIFANYVLTVLSRVPNQMHH